MSKVLIVRWCEIHLKGKNKGFFEKLLFDNIKHAIKDIDCKLVRIQGRYLIENLRDFDVEYCIAKLKTVSGIHSVSLATCVDTSLENIKAVATEICKDKTGTFKVETKRADKKFEINSVELSKMIGGEILRSNKDLSVDVHNPNFTVFIDIRETKQTLIYTSVIKMMGGMPVGSSSKGLVMLSGGIDSPVASYMMIKRGMKLEAVHFHSYPYTGEMAKQKVVELAEIISSYNQGMTLHVVKFTEIQEAIHEKLPEEYMITMMRRFMMRISERIANKRGLSAIITGECLGQVASQTIESITSSQSVVKVLPVLRPLIGFDKLEIIDIATNIGTYETSVLPYEDCCTVFLPKYPLIKPKLEKVEYYESLLDVEGLIENALNDIETILL
ncbi:MAG: tRNA 4-thiouridine(8) synthase ThiI [Clostridia bacterium]|nr:tRNA 4-thiouridine(8) synthase ThiI [Clostridia bacterium]